MNKIFLGLGIVFASLASFVLVPTVFAGGNDTVGNPYFSIEIPDSWTYIEYSSTPESAKTGFGPGNEIWLTPSEFSDILLIDNQLEIIGNSSDGGAIASFIQDSYYRIKNAPLESYVKYVIDSQGISNITSQQYTTVGKEKSISIYANNYGGLDNTNIALYTIMHDNQPYAIIYMANAKNYEKYLPTFEQMVKSFRFVDIPSGIENLSENEKKQIQQPIFQVQT